MENDEHQFHFNNSNEFNSCSGGKTVGSCHGFSLATSFDEFPLVPLVGGKHLAAVMDAEDSHLISVLKILQQLKTNTAGAKVQENAWVV